MKKRSHTAKRPVLRVRKASVETRGKIFGRGIRVTVSEHESVCHAGARRRTGQKTCFSVEIAGDIARLNFTFPSKPALRWSEDSVYLGDLRIRLGSSRDLVEINGQWHCIGYPGTRVSYEFSENGTTLGAVI